MLFSGIIGAIVVGAVIGVLARLIRPGKQNISVIETVLIGIVAGLIGGLIMYFFKYKNESGGVPWLAWLVALIVAVILIPIYEQLRGRAKA